MPDASEAHDGIVGNVGRRSNPRGRDRLLRAPTSLSKARSRSGNSPKDRSPSVPLPEIDERVHAFLDRPLAGEWPYLWLDATYLKQREGGRIVAVAAIIAVAANSDGRREIVGLHIGPSEAETQERLAQCSCHHAPASADSDRADGFVLAAARVWSSSRLSNPAASRDCRPVQQSASTVHDQHAPAAIPHCRASSTPISHRRRPPSANRNCQRRLRPPKRRSLTTRPPFRSCARRPNPTPR